MNEHEQNNKQRSYFLKNLFEYQMFRFSKEIFVFSDGPGTSHDHECEANAGKFLARTQTNIGKLRLSRCKTVKNKKKLQDLKAHLHTYTKKQIFTIWIVPTHKQLNLVEAGWYD